MRTAQQTIDAGVTEAEFRAMIKRAAKLAGWEVYYIPDSRKASSRGCPDLLLCHPKKLHLGILAWELKVGKNKPTHAQVMWLKAFAVNNPHARVVRPEDWGYVVATLTSA